MNPERQSVTEISAVAVATAFVSAVLYIYGMSVSLSFSLFDYLTTTDYLTFSIKWLTPTLVMASLGLIVHLFSERVERGMTEAEIAASTKNPKRTNVLRNLPWVIIEAIVVFATVVYFIGWRIHVVSDRTFYEVASGTLPLMWIIFASWYLSAPKLVQGWTKTRTLLFIFLPTLLVFSMFRGLYQGEVVISDGLPAKKIVTENTSLDAQVVLNLDGYYLIKKKSEKEIVVIRRSRVQEIREQLGK